jgi:hypothetical protein
MLRRGTVRSRRTGLPARVDHRLRRAITLFLSEVLPVLTIDDGAEELCPLPKRESDSEASKDRTTNM